MTRLRLAGILLSFPNNTVGPALGKPPILISGLRSRAISNSYLQHDRMENSQTLPFSICFGAWG